MRLYLTSIVVVLLSMLLFSCQNTTQELIRAEALIESNPDSALTLIDRLLASKTIRSDKDFALSDLLKVQIYTKKGAQLQPDSVLNFAINYYSKHSDGNRLASCYFYKGRLYKKQLDFEKAMENYLKAEETLTNKTDAALLGRLNMDVGEILYYQNEYKPARGKFITADSLFLLANMQPQSFSCKMNYGRTYKDEKKYNTAIQYYLSVVHLAKDSLQAGALLQEIALNFSKWNKPDSALLYYRKVLKYPNYENNLSIRYYQLADLFSELHQTDSALQYAFRSFHYQPDIRTKRECYRVIVNSKAEKNDLKAVAKYMSLYQDCTDSIRKIDAQTKGSYIETMHNTKREATSTRYKLLYALIFLFVVIVGSIAAYFLKHQRHQTERKQAVQQQQQQKTDLRFEVVTRTREALQQSLAAKRAEMAANTKQYVPEERCKMIFRLYGELIHFNDKHFFRHEMDAIMNHLYSKLAERYPMLNEKEIQWACLFMMKIPVEDILYLLDSNAEALKKLKQRFAKKVGVQYTSNIEAFLNSILAE